MRNLKTISSMVAISFCIVGCARFSTVQRDISYNCETGKPIREIVTKAGAYTVWASDSQLANWEAAQSNTNQGAKVGAVNQKTDVINSNVTAIVTRAVEAYLKTVSPIGQ